MTPRTLSREQARRIDTLAVDKLGVPSIALMENAARQVADHAMAMLGADAAKRHVLILCGGGNNGGDGLAAARHLHLRGVAVHIVLLTPPTKYTGDAGANLAICRNLGLTITQAADAPMQTVGNLDPADLVIDALLGTGLSSEVRSPQRDMIAWLNDQPADVLAVDNPSGLDCDKGVPLGIAVKAARTVTFVARKPGFDADSAAQFVGAVYVADIGVPDDLNQRYPE